MSYAAFYTTNLLVNVILIAFYVVQIFTSHTECMTEDDSDITTYYELAFILGLAIFALELVTSNVFAIYFRFRI